MSKVLCEKSDLVAIANSVRNKTGITGGMKVTEIPQKIEAIETGGNIKLQEKSLTITSNGTTTVTPDTSYDALSKVAVTVNVASGDIASTIVKITTILPNEDVVNILGISPEKETLSLTLDAETPTAEIEIIQNSPLTLACSSIADSISGTNCVNYFGNTYDTKLPADMYLYSVVFLDENDNPVTSGTLRIEIFGS